jgi:hypothetical protein
MWGSINTNTTDSCKTCPNSKACKSSVQALNPVLCESPSPGNPGEGPGVGAQGGGLRPRKTWVHRDYPAHLTPGEVFTAADLAARVGASAHAAATWLAHQCATTGAIHHAGKTKTADRNYAKLYRYQP